MAPTPLDVCLRHQFLMERVKRGRDAAVAALIALLTSLVRARFARLSVATFADMTKAQFNIFVKGVVSEIAESLNDFIVDQYGWLQQLSGVDADVASAVYAVIAKEYDSKNDGTLHGPQAATDNDRLWSKVAAMTLAATGQTMWQGLTAFRDYGTGLVARRIMAAQTDAETPAQTLQAIVGTDILRNRDGVLETVRRSAKAISNTHVQHISQNAQAATSSTVFDRYQWVSVLDSKTTEICQERDGRTYAWGQGPTPPAHVNCRSSIVGYDTTPYDMSPTVNEWLGLQPQDVRDILLDDSSLDIETYGRQAPDILLGDE